MSSTTKRVNVLVYAGPGATQSSVQHATWSLRRLLGPHYAVLTVTADQLLKEPWTASCALLVFPGGADLGYCRALNGAGNRRIRQYVHLGGRYLGLCAGGYYGSARCEFEVGRVGDGMEVVGDRELGFFPGVCRGLAFPGFVYHSEAGARATPVTVHRDVLAAAGGGGSDSGNGGPVPERWRTYYNGGGVFVDAGRFRDRGVEILASYVDDLAVHAGRDQAAVVYCPAGQGAAVLTGPHPEFSGVNLNPAEPSGPPDYPSVVAALVADEAARIGFMKACLAKLGLQVSQEATAAVPSLSRLHLSAADSSQVAELLHSWHEAGIVTTREHGEEVITAENDTFVLEHDGRWEMGEVARALPDASSSPAAADAAPTGTTTAPAPEAGLDYNAIPKRVVCHESALPDSKETPHFNHQAFFANLVHYQDAIPSDTDRAFGRTLLYGEVVTSTSTLLEKNTTLLSHLPVGLTATATTQVAARGRGTNAWVSPPGSLMFSTVMRHSLALSAHAPVVFIQYLAALAVVAGVHAYDRGGYDRIPVKLKWPNDVYARDPSTTAADAAYVKIGGILVNSSYAGGDYTLVCGIGLNVGNAAPTTSLDQLAAQLRLPPFTLEKLLASILTQFERLYARFSRTGFDRELQALYYASWLHADQVVTLETEGGARARIKGITADWGLLLVDELGRDDRPTGRTFQLQSDSNSFDFLRGLLKRKV